MKYIFLALAFIGFLLGGYAFYEKSAQQDIVEQNKVAIEMMPQVSLGASNSTFVGGQTYTLSGGGISSTGSSIDLTSFTIPQSGYKLTISNFGDTGGIVYGTIEPGNRTKQEFVSCTGVTQNSDGTARLTGCSRGLSPFSPYTASSTLAFSHSGSSPFIIAISPAQYDTFLNKYNDATSSALLTFSSTSLPRVELTTTMAQLAAATNTFVTYQQLINTAFSGAVDASEVAKGLAEAGTAAEQASSTALGGTGAMTFMRTRYSTDTPQSKCNSSGSANGAGCSVIARMTGKISQLWLDLTEAFTFSGAVTFNSTTTHAGMTTLATTIISGSFVDNASTTINGSLYVAFASSTLLQTTSGTTYTLNANDTERSAINASFTKLKETNVGMIQGPISVYFECKGQTANGHCQIYKNGTAVGTDRTGGNGSYSPFTETITVSPNDMLQVYGKNTDAGNAVYIQNFRLQTANGIMNPTASINY